jgi:hypothetical protein
MPRTAGFSVLSLWNSGSGAGNGMFGEWGYNREARSGVEKGEL